MNRTLRRLAAANTARRDFAQRHTVLKVALLASALLSGVVGYGMGSVQGARSIQPAPPQLRGVPIPASCSAPDESVTMWHPQGSSSPQVWHLVLYFRCDQRDIAPSYDPTSTLP